MTRKGAPAAGHRPALVPAVVVLLSMQGTLAVVAGAAGVAVLLANPFGLPVEASLAYPLVLGLALLGSAVYLARGRRPGVAQVLGLLASTASAAAGGYLLATFLTWYGPRVLGTSVGALTFTYASLALLSALLLLHPAVRRWISHHS